MELIGNKVKELSRAQQRRRDDILQAALKIFDQDGFEAAKMADIAKEADVAKGTLYLYFDTKADLLEGVIETAIIPTLQKIGEASQSRNGKAKDMLARQVQLAALRMASPEMKTLLRHMISGGPKHQKVIKFYYDNVVKKGVEHFQATLAYGVETGEFRKEAKEIDVLVLVGAPIYSTVWNILFEDMEEIDIENLTKDFLEVVMNGLLADGEADA